MTLNANNLPQAVDSESSPVVVALGGGHGLAATLEAASSYASKVVGVVSVADDGGSSGVLRHELGVEAPGDARRCISTLAAKQTIIGRALEYRFETGVLKGHPIGNLLLAGLAVSGEGGFQQAIDELCRIVGLDSGSIFAATDEPVELVADCDDGELRGQMCIEDVPNIGNLRFDPPDPKVSDAVVEALLGADQIVIGPGSMFTSVLAAVCVPRIIEAIGASSAQRVFVANVANEWPKVGEFGLDQYANTLAEHEVPIDLVIANGAGPSSLGGYAVEWAEVADANGWGHDPAALGKTLWRVYCSR